MSRTTRFGLIASASVAAFSGVTLADDTTMSAEQMAARIAELEAKMAQFTNGDTWLTEQRADEIRGLVQDVLADADTRASLLQSGTTAGYDDGFVLGSADGMFSLKINGLVQARAIYNNASGADAGVDENRFGFENTRTRLNFSGNVGEQWHYNVRGTFGPYGAGDSGDFELEDAYLVHKYGDSGWMSMIGQFRAPGAREWLVDEGNQLAVERSNVVYNQGTAVYVQGAGMAYMQDTFRAVGAVSNGAQGGSNGSALQRDTEFAFSARAEFLLSGTWEQFEDFTSPMGSEQGMLLGASFHWENGEYGDATPDELEVTQVTVDFSWENDGWNVYGGAYYTTFDDDNTIDSNVFAVVLQGGLYLNADWELFARYEWQDFDTDNVEDLSLVTIGVNNYIGGNAKWTTDVGFGLDEVEAANGVTGWRADADDEDGQFVIRSQFQLSF